jgi:Rrf2 family protein
MLALTRKTHYALIALSHLGRDPGGFSNAREIAAQYQLPESLLMNLLKRLAQKELVRSVRGPKGGYTLALPPEQISVTDVVRAVEGRIHVAQCVPDKAVNPEEDDAADCVRMGTCPIRASLAWVHDRMIEYLDSLTLAQVIAANGRSSRGRMPVAEPPGGMP